MTGRDRTARTTRAAAWVVFGVTAPLVFFTVFAVLVEAPENLLAVIGWAPLVVLVTALPGLVGGVALWFADLALARWLARAPRSVVRLAVTAVVHLVLLSAVAYALVAVGGGSDGIVRTLVLAVSIAAVPAALGTERARRRALGPGDPPAGTTGPWPPVDRPEHAHPTLWAGVGAGLSVLAWGSVAAMAADAIGARGDEGAYLALFTAPVGAYAGCAAWYLDRSLARSADRAPGSPWWRVGTVTLVPAFVVVCAYPLLRLLSVDGTDAVLVGLAVAVVPMVVCWWRYGKARG